jgi:hypothetical protein
MQAGSHTKTAAAEANKCARPDFETFIGNPSFHRAICDRMPTVG